jgi:protein-S-isoprenylcysteine O-methyltransferase Ste14
MQASAIEFRLRMAILIVIPVLGYWAPWTAGLNIGQRTSLLEWMAVELSRMGLLRFSWATPAVIVLGALLAAIGAILRVWGAAYLDYDTVHDAEMHATLVADGPYRYLRNPLYVGGWCMLAAVSFIMPVTGALFCMTLLTVFFLRLILREEAFLIEQSGESYRRYMDTVPRLLPRLRSAPPAAGHKPHWITAILTELNPIGVFIAMAVLSWGYDHRLMIRAILVTFGASLVVRALMPRAQAGSNSAN